MKPSDWKPQLGSATKPIVYLSGNVAAPNVPPTYQRVYEATGHEHFCVSYLYCAKEEERYSKDVDEGMKFGFANKLHMFLDSGAFSFQAHTYSKDVGVEERSRRGEAVHQRAKDFAKRYVAFVKSHPPGAFDFYVNLDYVTSCPVIYEMHEYLNKLGIRPIPVYHGDMGTDWMQRYVDGGHKLIGIGLNRAAGAQMGAKRRRYYDKCFEFATKAGISLHGFMCTGSDMFAYPWYSVDSASWAKLAATGSIFRFIREGRRVRVVSCEISKKKTPKWVGEYSDLKDEVARHGYTFEELQSSYVARGLYNVKVLREAIMKKQGLTRKEVNWKGVLC